MKKRIYEQAIMSTVPKKHGRIAKILFPRSAGVSIKQIVFSVEKVTVLILTMEDTVVTQTLHMDLIKL